MQLKAKNVCYSYSQQIQAKLYMQVLRCQRPRRDQCQFFLWERDEPTAREQSNLANPAVPQTPTKCGPAYNQSNPRLPMFATPPGESSTGKRRLEPVAHLPTPNSKDGISRPTFLRSLEMSPTPHRSYDMEFAPDDDIDLSTTILELLRSNNVVIRASTEVLLRHTVGLAIGAYESKLRISGQTIFDLCKKVDSLERTLEVKAHP